MNLLCLLGCGGLACADCPYWLVGYDDVFPLVCREMEYAAGELCLAYGFLLVSLTLFEALADAEDDLQSVGECEFHFLLEYFRCLVVVFAALRVSENDIFRTC